MTVKNRKSKSTHEAHNSINDSVEAIEQELDEIRSINDSIPSQRDNDNDEDEDHESNEKTKKRSSAKSDTRKKGFTGSRKVIFILGAIIGILIAAYFGAKQENVLNLKDFDSLVNFESVQGYLDDWKDSFPTNLQLLLTDYQTKTPDFTESFAVGQSLKAEYKLSSKYPVIMIPGVTSTGIESWSLTGTEDCPSKPHFRKRLWGSMYMLRSMFLDKACWLKHIMLDLETGLDPEGITLRAAQGFEAADFFMAGYWIWNKILENLAAIGYEPNKMITASYDWRLSFLDLERRDSYFSKLKHHIELEYHMNGEKSILIGHSMGSQIAFYFMKWVEAEGPNFGNGGPNWVNKYISAFVDISGSMLGAPKAVPALLSGEMKDTVQLNALALYGLEKFFSRRERLDMLRTFGGVASMLPKGGELIWGNLTSAYEDRLKNHSKTEVSLGNFIRFEKEIGILSSKNLTVGDSIDYLLENSPEWFSRRTNEHYSNGVSKTPEELIANNQDFSKWVNPLEAALPNAPDLKVFCFYGFGNPTERAYIYQEEVNRNISRLNITIAQTSEKPTVFFTDGDGTIPILTHAMCHKWKTSSNYNPGGSAVKIVEIKHEPNRFDIRGGAKTAEHVDILGSAELNELVLKVAAGRDDLINERIITDLPEWVESMDFGFD